MKSTLVIILINLLAVSSSLACMCTGRPDLVTSYNKYETIFLGKVDSISTSEDASSGVFKVTFLVIENFKSDSLSRTVDIYTSDSESACGYPFVQSKEYIVFSNIAGRDSPFARPGELSSMLCDPTVSVETTRLNGAAGAKQVHSLLKRFKDKPPSIPVTPCGLLQCDFTEHGLADAERIFNQAYLNPLEAFDLATQLPDECARKYARRNIAELWAESDPVAMFKRLDGDFSQYLLCEYQYAIEDALPVLAPADAIAWLERNTDGTFFPRIDPVSGLERLDYDAASPKRVPFESHFSRWLKQDFDAALVWYEANSEAIRDSVFLTVTVFDHKPDLFLSKLDRLGKTEQLRVVMDIVQDYELYQNRSSNGLVKSLRSPVVLAWGKLLVDSINGVVPPDAVLDKTVGYFKTGDSETRFGAAPDEIYQIVQMLSWNSIPAAVRAWIDNTPHLNEFVRSDLHAMLDSRQ